MERVEGDLELLRELIEMTMTEFRTTQPRLMSLVDSGDFAEIAERAHSLKGTFGNIGAMSCREITMQIEAEAKRGSAPAIKELLIKLVSGVEAYRSAVREILLTA